jgi:integrase
MINLAEVKPQQEEAVAGAKLKPIEAEAKILEHAWMLKKQGYKESTIRQRVAMLKRIVKLGADLSNPESVKDVIARKDVSEATKLQLACAYDSYASANRIQWEIPNYSQSQKLPFIPLESEIDALIAGCGKKTATILQLLKETGMRIGEAWRLKWVDLDLEAGTVRVNEPEKNSNSRILKLSNKLIGMLDALPRKSEKIFGSTELQPAASHFWRQRRRLAQKLQNPRLDQISFHTLRHWKATTEYHRTRDILYVKHLLGHKSINNTMLYTQLISFESDEYASAVAKTLDEARKLVESGFEYVIDVEGVNLLRKRKWLKTAVISGKVKG